MDNVEIVDDIIKKEIGKRYNERYEYLTLNGNKYLLTLRKNLMRWEVALWRIGIGTKILVDENGERTYVLKKQKKTFKTYDKANNYFNTLIAMYKGD